MAARRKDGPLETCCNSAYAHIVKAEDFTARGHGKEAKDRLHHATQEIAKAQKEAKGRSQISKLVSAAKHHVADAEHDLESKRFGSARLHLLETDRLISAARTEASLKNL